MMTPPPAPDARFQAHQKSDQEPGQEQDVQQGEQVPGLLGFQLMLQALNFANQLYLLFWHIFGRVSDLLRSGGPFIVMHTQLQKTVIAGLVRPPPTVIPLLQVIPPSKNGPRPTPNDAAHAPIMAPEPADALS